MIAKVLDKNSSLAKKVLMLIGILVEVLLPSGEGEAAQAKGGGKPENIKEWLRNKLKGEFWVQYKLGLKE